MEQYANPDSESRAVGDHAIPAVEEVMTDERLCTCPLYIQTVSQFTCPAHGLVRNGKPVEAAPSTDEGEARWERGEESPDIVVWRAVRREVLPYVEMPKSLEAAIRAPLEERMGELTLERDAAEGFAQSLQAENERLREAVIWMSGSADFGPGQPAHEHWVKIRDTLLFPSSSTGGSGTQVPD